MKIFKLIGIYMEKKEYMFQYHNGIRTIEDTGLITLEEGMALWEKYRHRFLYGLADKDNVAIVLWKNCTNETDYVDYVFNFDNETRYDNGRFYKLEKVYLDKELSNLTK